MIPRLIDRRGADWSHNLKPTPDGALRGIVTCGGGVDPSDFLLWTTAYGEALAVARAVSWCGDPADAYDITAEVTQRRLTPAAWDQLIQRVGEEAAFDLIRQGRVVKLPMHGTVAADAGAVICAPAPK